MVFFSLSVDYITIIAKFLQYIFNKSAQFLSLVFMHFIGLNQQFGVKMLLVLTFCQEKNGISSLGVMG